MENTIRTMSIIIRKYILIILFSVVGELARVQSGEVEKVLDEWIEDENMWLRRTAILHQLLYKDKTDAERLFRY